MKPLIIQDLLATVTFWRSKAEERHSLISPLLCSYRGRVSLAIYYSCNRSCSDTQLSRRWWKRLPCIAHVDPIAELLADGVIGRSLPVEGSADVAKVEAHLGKVCLVLGLVVPAAGDLFRRGRGRNRRIDEAIAPSAEAVFLVKAVLASNSNVIAVQIF